MVILSQDRNPTKTLGKRLESNWQVRHPSGVSLELRKGLELAGDRQRLKTVGPHPFRAGCEDHGPKVFVRMPRSKGLSPYILTGVLNSRYQLSDIQSGSFIG